MVAPCIFDDVPKNTKIWNIFCAVLVHSFCKIQALKTAVLLPKIELAPIFKKHHQIAPTKQIKNSRHSTACCYIFSSKFFLILVHKSYTAFINPIQIICIWAIHIWIFLAMFPHINCLFSCASEYMRINTLHFPFIFIFSI